MTTKDEQGMDLRQLLTDLVLEHLDAQTPDADALSGALYLRGLHAVQGGGELAEDEPLRELPEDTLVEAALLPGVEIMRRRFSAALEAVADVDDELAAQAEEALADVLDQRDRCRVKARSLEVLGLERAAGCAGGELNGLDEQIRLRREDLGWVAHMAAEATTRSPLRDSIWHEVPAPPEEAPRSNHVTGGPVEVTDEELLQVALDLAGPALESQVAAALDRDPALRERYDEVLADLEHQDDADADPPETRSDSVALPVHSMLGAEATQARRMDASRMAAATGPVAYETPPAEALCYVYRDDSQLFVQREGDEWVVLLYRTSPGAGDAATGQGVEQWEDGNLLVVRTRRDEVVIDYGGDRRRCRLGPAAR